MIYFYGVGFATRHFCFGATIMFCNYVRGFDGGVFEKKYPGPTKFCYWTHPSARAFKKEDAVNAFDEVKNNYAN